MALYDRFPRASSELRSNGLQTWTSTPGPIHSLGAENPAGMTPTTVYGFPSSRIVRPRIPGLDPKPRAQRP